MQVNLPSQHQILNGKPPAVIGGDFAATKRHKSSLRELLASLKHLDITGSIQKGQLAKNAFGGYGDVFVGYYPRPNSDCRMKVAIKCLRIHIFVERDFAKMLTDEIRVWSRLSHPNILTFVGYALENEDYPLLVSEWMENGTVNTYVRDHADCDVFGLVSGIADGLSYLHSKEVIHGDMKADNVLVSGTGKPQICDFGISRLVSRSETLRRSSTNHRGVKGSLRWMAPELLFQEDDGPEVEQSEITDTWAFGMTVYELLTGNIPYAHIKLEAKILCYLYAKKFPLIPEEQVALSFKQQCLWNICEECWEAPEKRPDMKLICNKLHANDPLEYKTYRPFLIKSNLFRSININYLDNQYSQKHITEIIHGFNDRILEHEDYKPLGIFMLSDKWSEHAVDPTLTNLVVLDEKTHGKNGMPLKKPYKISVHNTNIGYLDNNKTHDPQAQEPTPCLNNKTGGVQAVNELWILNTSTQVVSATDYNNQIMVDLLPAQSYSSMFFTGTTYNLRFVCNGVVKVKQYHAVNHGALYIDIYEVFRGENIGVFCRKVPLTTLDSCGVTFENRGNQIITIRQTELEIQLDIEPWCNIYLDLICWRSYCFTFVCHGTLVDQKFTNSFIIDISKPFEETKSNSYTHNRFPGDADDCVMGEVTFYNPGLLIVSVEQSDLAVKYDLLPGTTKVVTMHYKEGRKYHFTFKRNGLVTFQSHLISSGLTIVGSTSYSPENVLHHSSDVRYMESLWNYPQRCIGVEEDDNFQLFDPID